jgi:hypothetical protein
MRTIRFITVAAIALAVTAATAANAVAAREFEGKVVSINREARTFSLKDVERGTVRIKVTRSTRFERIDGFAGLKVGAKNIEAIVKRKNGGLIALSVERSGGGGEHGGADDRGGDHDRGGDDNPSTDDR